MSPTAGRRTRVAYLTQWFTPEPITVPRWIADVLAQRFDVTVVTGQPNYPTGRVLPGYQARAFGREHIDGLPVRRTPLFAAHDSSAVKRLLNYGSWALSATLGAARELREADVALVYSSPATAALPAMVWRVLNGTPYVMIIQDLWPDSIFASGFLTGPVGRIADAALTAFCQASYALSAHICVISPGMRDLLISRGVPEDRITLVYNWVDEAIFQPTPADPEFRSSLGLDAGDFVVCYAGNHGAAQGLGTLIDAVAQLPDNRRVHAVLIGDGVEKPALQAHAATVAPGRVHFLDPRPAAAMASLMSATDLQLVSLVDEPLFRITMPSKVQSILATGNPALVSAPGDAARVVDEAEAGWTAPPADPSALADAIVAAQDAGADERKRRGHHGLVRYRAEMSASVGARRLGDILNTAAAKEN